MPDWSDETGIIQIWDDGFHGVSAYEGDVFAELNADAPGTLYQDICLISGETIEWSFAHRARVGSEGADPQTVILEIADPVTSTVIQQIEVQNSLQGSPWNTNSGSVVYNGSTGLQRLQFRTPNPGSYGNFIDGASLNLSALAEFSSPSSFDVEASGQNVPTIRVSGHVDNDTLIPVNVVSGNADTADFTLSNSSMVVPAGQYTDEPFELPLVIIDDNIGEGDETIQFSPGTPDTSEIIYARPACDGEPPQTTHTYTIRNDDVPLSASKSQALFSPKPGNSYAIPDTDIIYTITVMNIGEVDVDDNSLFLVDSLPVEVEFFNGDLDGVGPETGPIAFSTQGSHLALDPGTGVRYSNQQARPQSLDDCNYVPLVGYDEAVQHVCLAPTGTLGFGTPIHTSRSVFGCALSES